MLSVLIPVYEYDIHPLIADLTAQLKASGKEWELLISDVSAEPCLDVQSLQVPNLQYFHQQRQLSRAENRNFLAGKSQFSYLLFIDADAQVLRKDFIKRYLDHIKPNRVICGGTVYSDKKPDDPSLMLRWVYGNQREVRSAAERSKLAAQSFSSFNFLVPRAIFESHPFDIRFRYYGHEDTYFGYQLNAHGITILHIDNPLIHNGLEPADQFLLKTREGVQSLAALAREPSISAEFLGSIKLWSVYLKLRKFRLVGLFERYYHLRQTRIEKNLRSHHPNIRLFDLYKLAYLVKIQG